MAPILVALPLIMTAASSATAAIGAVRSAQAQQASANYNAEIAKQNADAARAQGEAAVQAQQRDAQRKQGSAIATFGAAGVDASTGSPSDVLADSTREATLDSMTTRYNYQLRSLGYSDQSQLDTAQGKNAMSAGWVNATSDILAGATKFYEYGQDTYGWGKKPNASN
jgi:hypothetical protein